jgi:hypothetical protein
VVVVVVSVLVRLVAVVQAVVVQVLLKAQEVQRLAV